MQMPFGPVSEFPGPPVPGPDPMPEHGLTLPQDPEDDEPVGEDWLVVTLPQAASAAFWDKLQLGCHPLYPLIQAF